MSGTYPTRGIILHKIPFQENDLLVTLLSPEYGLIRAVAPGAKKYKSLLRGRIQLFVINDFLLVKGRNLERIIQVETVESYPKLSINIGKLTASQYLAELVLNWAINKESQAEFYNLLTEYLTLIERLGSTINLFPYLAQAVFNCLVIAGIAPESNYCIRTGQVLIPDFEQPNWRVGFSFAGGGLINFKELNQSNNITFSHQVNAKLNAVELTLFQSLTNKCMTNKSKIIINNSPQSSIDNAWLKLERTLKDYSEFHIGKKLKSAEIVTDILVSF
jgi:DNA repair protein RecO (recombination protein O)